MIYEGILGPHEGFKTLQKEPSDFPGGEGGASVILAEFIIIVAMGACWCLSQSCVYIHLQY